MTTTVISWNYGSNQTINFNPATDVLNFGWFSAGQFAISEVNGSVIISIPSNSQTYTLQGVTLSKMSSSNILASDSSAQKLWTDSIDIAHNSTTTVEPIQPAPSPTPPQTTVPFEPTPTPPANPTLPPTAQMIEINWHWGQTKSLSFNPAVDKLNFGWIQNTQYTVNQVGSDLIIALPTNNQQYILKNITLNQLSSANIISLDTGTKLAWEKLLSGSTENATKPVEPSPTPTPTPIEPTPTPPSPDPTKVGYADPFTATKVYISGDKASVGNAVYQATWWTQGTDPSKDSSGNWKLLGYFDSTPVKPEPITGLYAVATGDTSTLLIWDKATIKGVGTISEYQVYESGKLVATTQDTSFKITNLNPNTSYNFTIVAVDEAGSSNPSTPTQVLTDELHNTGVNQYFSPYIDMSLTTSQDLVKVVKESGVDHLTLAFMLNSGKDQIGWGGIGSIQNDSLSNGSTMKELITNVQKLGTDITISFGGANGIEPALAFSNAEALQKAYQSVIDTYNVNKLDFDIEGGAIANKEANHLRDIALAKLDAINPDLEISFTLPVLPTGLTIDGINILKQAKADGVNIDVVNIMAMDYGEIADSGDMGTDAINAALSTIAQLNEIGLDAKVGITPMIGINDVQSEVFTLQDAQQLMDFAKGNEDIASIGMWSLGRDNGSTFGQVSPIGSGLDQSNYAYADIFNGL